MGKKSNIVIIYKLQLMDYSIIIKKKSKISIYVTSNISIMKSEKL